MGLPVPFTVAVAVARRAWHPSLATDLAEALLKHFDASQHHGNLCLRSSTASEDQSTSSQAGQWFSWFSVPQHPSRLATAICDYLTRLETMLGTRNAETATLSLMVQAEIACQASGVCFSHHPDPTFGAHALVQYTDGHGSHFTDGRVYGSTMLLSQWSSRTLVHRQDTRYRLDDTLAAQIYELSRRLHVAMDGPQDVEFGVDHEQLWVFQTRPVTAAMMRHDDHLWTRAAADEFWSGTVSDVMWSSVGDCIENCMLRRPLAALPDDNLWQQPLLKARGGYVYLNADPVRRILDDLPGWARVDALQAMVGRRTSWSVWPLAPLSFWRIVVSFLRAGFRWLPWMPLHDLPHTTARGQELFRQARAEPQSVAASTILGELELHLSNAVWGMVWAYVLVQLADRLVRRLTADHDDAISTAFGHNAKDPVFQLDNAVRHAAAARRAGRMDATATLLDQYGHLAFGRDITQPRWHERPQAVAAMVDASPTQALAARSDYSVLRSLSQMSRRQGLSSALGIWLLAPLILAGRRFVAWREAMRFGSDYYLAALRLALKPQTTEESNDISLAMWLHGDTPVDDPLDATSSLDTAAVYYGSALYRGTAEGTVYVIRRAEDIQHIPPGSILVSEYLDPSLGPLLACVQGAIFEFGGVLSHGGILCREHRIPSICGVRQATRRLHSGQRVRLLAAQGRVEVLA